MYATMDAVLFLLTLCTLCLTLCGSQTILSCPSYGCKPSGSFSFALNYPHANASIAWSTDFFIGPIPNALGCVGNSNNIICQTNGPSMDVGYISLYGDTGKLAWRDGILRFPQLPILDIFGDLIGSDGHYLIKIDDDGTVSQPIQLSDWVFPIFSIMAAENEIFVFVSRNGYVISYYPDGSPHASITLNGTVGHVNGTYIPIAPPVLAVNRMYVLTQFKPMDPSESQNLLSYHKLYAIDVFPRMLDRLHTAWSLQLELNGFDALKFKDQTNLNFRNAKKYSKHKRGNVEYFEQDNFDFDSQPIDYDIQPRVMSTTEIDRIYVSIPPANNGQNSAGVIYAIKDQAGDSNNQMLFQQAISLAKISMYTPSNLTSTPSRIRKSTFKIEKGPWKTRIARKSWVKNRDIKPLNENRVWGLENNLEILVEIDPLNGSALSHRNIPTIVGKRVRITSHVMVSRRHDAASVEVLIFGIQKMSPEPSHVFSELCDRLGVADTSTSYMVQLNGMEVSWMVASPKDLAIKGQIAGIQNSEEWSDDVKDLIVAFSGNGSISNIFGVW